MSQNGSQIAIAFSATKEYGAVYNQPIYPGVVIPTWVSSSRSYFSNILYSASPNSDPVVINRYSELVNMGFTEDGLLAIGAQYGESSVHNSKGEKVIYGYRVVERSPVPSGWTRAASNVNYAFKIETTGNYSYLKLLDLKTNIEKTVRSLWSGGKNPVRFTGNHDISPDGSTFIYETTEAGYSNIVTLMRVGNPAYQRRLWGSLESISFEKDSKIAVITIKDVSETFIVDLQTFDDLWTRTASNANFAFRVESVTHSSDPQRVLSLMDLRTGERREIARAHVANGSDISKVCDISPDGKFIIYETSGRYDLYDRNMPLGRHCTVHLQSMSDPTQTIELGNYIRYGQGSYGELSLTSIQFKGDIVRIARKNQGVTTLVEVNLETGVVRPGVPSGWTRAASNVNFAFAEVYERVGTYSKYTLKLQDLRTGQVRDISSRMLPYGGFTDVYDVSPDGTTVIYGNSGPLSPAPVPYTVILQRISRPSQKLVLNGKLKSVAFEQSGSVAALTLDNGSQQRVNIRTLKVVPRPVPSGWTQAASNVNYAFRVEFVPISSDPQRVLRLMDLRTGEQREIARAHVANGSDISKVCDISPDGKFIIYETSGRYDLYDRNMPLGRHCTVHLQSMSDPTQTIELGNYIRYGQGSYGELSLTSIQFKGDIVRIARKNQGVTTLVEVNLETGVVRPGVPSGWTRAASNVNFAFAEVYERVGTYSKYTLKLQDLRTGQVRDISSRMLPYGGFTDVYDVSPDGTTVIYGNSGPLSPAPVPYTVILQRISRPSQKLVLNGKLKSVAFEQSGSVAALTLDNGSQQRVNIRTLKVVLRPIPRGWKVVPSMATMAYQTISRNRVRVMDLMTGKVSERPTAQNQAGPSSRCTGLYYIMTSTGLKEIYEVKKRGRITLQSYDPVRKKWTSYKA